MLWELIQWHESKPKHLYIITTVTGENYLYETTIIGAKYVMESLLKNEISYIEVINNSKSETVIKTEYIVSIRKLKGEYQR